MTNIFEKDNVLFGVLLGLTILAIAIFALVELQSITCGHAIVATICVCIFLIANTKIK